MTPSSGRIHLVCAGPDVARPKVRQGERADGPFPLSGCDQEWTGSEVQAVTALSKVAVAELQVQPLIQVLLPG